MSTEHLDLSGFTRLDIRGAFRFEVVKSEAYGVTIDRPWFKHTRVFKHDDTLVIDHPWYDVLGWFTPWIMPRARVEMPGLRELRVSGASNGSTTGFSSSEDFRLRVRGASHVRLEITAGNSDFDLAGASRIELAASVKELKLKSAGASRLSGSLKAEKGDIDVVGASRISFKGTMGDAIIDVAGASRLDMGDFTVKNASIKLVGASQCTVNVDGKMDAELAGASRLVYGGNPVLGNVRSVGASTLTRK